MKLLPFAASQPELQRQLWLEFSLVRLFAMPAVLALVFVALALNGAEALAGAAQTGFVLLVWAYGARLASAALQDEVNEGTWDAQRLSSLSAWQLTAGKLFGGTAFAWYGGALCMGVWWMASWAAGLPTPWLASVAAVAGGLAIQAASLSLALAAARRSPSGSKRGGGGWWLLLIVVLPWAGGLSMGGGKALVWWGIAWPPMLFYAATAMVFAAWAVLGAWRMMAAALQVPLRPVVWLAFLVWLAVFFAGWIDTGSAPWRVAALLAVIASAAAYATLFLDPPRIDVVQRLAARWREAGWSRRTQERLPLMAVSTALSLGAGVLAVALALAFGLTQGAFAAVVDAFNAQARPASAAWVAGSLTASMPLALALLTLRDMALACALHWGREVRRAEGATLVLLVVVNLVLPWFLFAAGLPMLASWVQPMLGLVGAPGTDDVRFTVLLAAAVQAAGAVVWAQRRWRVARVASSR